MKKSILFSCIILSAAFAVADPSATVTDVSVNAASRLVTVSYTLSGEDAIVTLGFTVDGVAVDPGLVGAASGDVNRLVATGARTIYWYAPSGLADISSGNVSVDLKVWKADDPPKYMVIDLTLGTVVRYYESEDALPFGGLANDEYRLNSIVMRRIYTHGKTFQIGPSGGQVSVTMTNDYYIGIFPVTIGQWRHVSPTSRFSFDWIPGCEMFPACTNSVNSLRGGTVNYWPRRGREVSATAFLGKLRTHTGVEIDLPTEAQWEIAARAGETGDTYGDIDEIAWYGDNSAVDGEQRLHPVGLKKPNAWGIYDTLGNCEEWCLNLWASSIEGGTDPIGGDPGEQSGPKRVLRGGSYASDPAPTLGSRRGLACSTKQIQIGFRLVAPVSPTWNAQRGDAVGTVASAESHAIAGGLDTRKAVSAASAGYGTAETPFDTWCASLRESGIITIRGGKPTGFMVTFH